MNLQMLSLLSPPLASIADVLLSSLGQSQKDYISTNIVHLPNYLRSEDGRATLCMFLEAFHDHVSKATGVHAVI
jgi:hypothetical protein